MIKAGIAGVGFMGWIHYLAYQRSTQAKLAAFCTRDSRKRSGDWRGIKGNFGPPGEQIDVSALQVYDTLESMLDDPSIDLIDICLPPHLHVDAALKSLAAGKHVLCEKPLGLDTNQCDQILAASQKYNRSVLVAQVLPYMGQYEYVYKAVAEGTLGKALSGYFKRIISPPDWIPDFYDLKRIGGPLIDLHVHDMHFVRMVFGMPRRVMCTAAMKDGVVKFCHCLLEFDDSQTIVATSSGVQDQTSRPFTHGFEMVFEKGTVQFELAVLSDGLDIMPLKIMTTDGKILRPELPGADDISAFANEIDDAVTSIRQGKPQRRLDGQVARDAIHICHCLQLSAQSRGWVNCQ